MVDNKEYVARPQWQSYEDLSKQQRNKVGGISLNLGGRNLYQILTLTMDLIHICLHACLCVHGTAETLDGVAELPDTQTTRTTDVKETYS